MKTIKVLDRITRVTPLGIRFYDAVSHVGVAEGLEVNAYPTLRPEHRIPSVITPSGVFVFRGLPGLTSDEFGAGDNRYWKTIIPQEFWIKVKDLQRRFLPMLFDSIAPIQGFSQLSCFSPLSPPKGSPAIPLYSAPSRAVPGPVAVLRADLWDAQQNIPASWAKVEVHAGGSMIAHGLADADGRLTIMFSYPDLVDMASGSPPVAGLPLKQQRWLLDLQIRYQRWNPVPAIPDLCAVLNQPLSGIWRSRGPDVPARFLRRR